jgi:hypothetical protein
MEASNMTVLNSVRWRRARCASVLGVVAIVLASGVSLNAAAKPEEATQHARFYPAFGAAPALVVFRDEPGEMGESARRVGLTRSVEQMALDVFARYGLRVRMD